MGKVCKKCNIDKSIELFGIYKRAKDGLRAICKECRNNLENTEIKRERGRIWGRKNWEKQESKNKRKIYIDDNKEKIRIRQNKWRINKTKTDKLYSFTNVIRQSIRRSFINKGFTKYKSTEKILGCSIDEFRIYIESNFEDWMNWDNRGLYNGELNYGWDLDHKIPISNAITKEDVLILNHYTNLQPLCSKVNRDIKRNK